MKLNFVLYCLILFWKTIVCQNSTINVRILDNKYNSNPRIVGGLPVSIQSYPYMAQLRRYEFYKCGSSIISKSWVLTAAHCTFGYPAKHVDIRVGTDILSDRGVVHQLKMKREHPDYNFRNLDYDVAVLRLAKDIATNSKVRPIALALMHETFKHGTYCQVIGWGKMESSRASPLLRATTVPTVDQKVCRSWFKKFKREIKDFVICAGYETGKLDSCTGDSGGPLVYNQKQIGIVSWGLGCGRRKLPGIYTAVGHQSIRKFIKKMTRL